MSSRTALGAMCALATVFAPMAASAQQPTQPTPEVQEWIAEMQELQTELRPLQEQAMQDAALQREREQLTATVREAMVAADPANGERLDRLEQLMTEAQAAQAAGDTAKIAELTSEAQQIGPQVQAAQAEAMETPEVEARVQAFENNLFAKMAEMDPSKQARIDRLSELSQRVRQAMGRGGD